MRTHISGNVTFSITCRAVITCWKSRPPVDLTAKKPVPSAVNDPFWSSPINTTHERIFSLTRTWLSQASQTESARGLRSYPTNTQIVHTCCYGISACQQMSTLGARATAGVGRLTACSRWQRPDKDYNPNRPVRQGRGRTANPPPKQAVVRPGSRAERQSCGTRGIPAEDEFAVECSAGADRRAAGARN